MDNTQTPVDAKTQAGTVAKKLLGYAFNLHLCHTSMMAYVDELVSLTEQERFQHDKPVVETVQELRSACRDTVVSLTKIMEMGYRAMESGNFDNYLSLAAEAEEMFKEYWAKYDEILLIGGRIEQQYTPTENGDYTYTPSLLN